MHFSKDLYCDIITIWETYKHLFLTYKNSAFMTDREYGQLFFLKAAPCHVTLSGGEVLMQIDFVQILLAECKKNGLHTAIETSGFAPSENLKRIISLTDLFLFDIKHYNSHKHIQGTGVSNDIIIENLHMLIKAEKNVLVRIPVIPDFNNSLNDADGFAHLFNKIGVKEIQLLPFHQFGQNKYRQLGLPYKFENYTSLHTEDLQEYKRRLEAASLKVIL